MSNRCTCSMFIREIADLVVADERGRQVGTGRGDVYRQRDVLLDDHDDGCPAGPFWQRMAEQRGFREDE